MVFITSRIIFGFLAALFFTCKAFSDPPQLPMGMNLPDLNYYVPAVPFLDLKMSSSDWITYNASGSSPWDTEKASKLEKDPQGYPLEIPAKIPGSAPQAVRFLINNQNPGRFRFLYDGQGEFEFHVPKSVENGLIVLTLDGSGDNSWINITNSKKGNHVRNVRIIPIAYSNTQSPPLFNPLYVEGIKPFHCLRFMDWMRINNSSQESWESRVLPTYHTQGSEKGAAIEHAIALCNQLKTNAWFCVLTKRMTITYANMPFLCAILWILP